MALTHWLPTLLLGLFGVGALNWWTHRLPPDDPDEEEIDNLAW